MNTTDNSDNSSTQANYVIEQAQLFTDMKQTLIEIKDLQKQILVRLGDSTALERERLDTVSSMEIVDISVPFRSMVDIVVKWSFATLVVSIFFAGIFFVIYSLLALMGILIF